jgi:hypothetical protein
MGQGEPSLPKNPIEDLYKSELGRASDPGGLEFWTNAYNNGMSINDIRDQGFRASEEYKNRPPQPTFDPYTPPEVYNPYNPQLEPQLPSNPYNPPEVSNPYNPQTEPQLPSNPYNTPRPQTGLEAISELYRTMLDREPDEEGLQFWTNAFNNGMSLNDIRNQGFFPSEEYQNRIRSMPFEPPKPRVDEYAGTQWEGTGGPSRPYREPSLPESNYPAGYDPVTGTAITPRPARTEGSGYGYGQPPQDIIDAYNASNPGYPAQRGYPFFQTLPGFGQPPQDIIDAYNATNPGYPAQRGGPFNYETSPQADPVMDFVQNIDQQLPYLQRAFQEQLQRLGDPAAAARAVLGSLR